VEIQMRKTILMGLGLALSLAGVSAAQQGTQDAPRRERAAGRGPGGPGGRFEGRGADPRGALLKGITLTDAQKTQLKTLRKAQHDKMDAHRDQFDKQREEMRAARQKGDTVAVRAIMERNRVAMEQARTQEIAAIRNILTAEQRVQFDKNVAELKQREAERGKRFGQRGEGKGFRGRSGR
jgi:periplasmic protein CpxP/Spy